jgi:2-polyprenyl-3-methyl-5-hydroxy-6-metoxy-1,4-benzoquinol methylase
MSQEERKQKVVELCRGKRVLHLGCTDWPFTEEKIREHSLLHAMIAEVATDLVGVDISDEGLAHLAKADPKWKLVNADACTYVPDFPVDVVVASELIEHLENPGQLFRGIARWATEKVSVVVTTPNAQSLKSALRALVGKEECHPDHTVVFSTKTITQLLDRTGWDVEKIEYYRVPAQRFVTRLTSGCLRLLEMFASRRACEGLIVLARKR